MRRRPFTRAGEEPVTQKFEPKAYGIDFGTSNSLVSAASERGVHSAVPLDPGAQDPTVLRSILHFAPSGECTFGAGAIDRYIQSGMQGRLLRSLKRFLPSPAFTRTFIGSRQYRLEDLIGAVLRAIRERANAFFDCDVRAVVLGRPALFSEVSAEDELAERRLRSAAELAGFESVEFCPEPVAAARDFQNQLDTTKLILVADFGGGTSDFSVVRMGPEPFSKSDVLAIGGVRVAGDALEGAMMRENLSHHFGAAVRYRVPMGKNTLTMPKPVRELLCSPAEMSLLQRRDLHAFLRNVRGWSLAEEDREAMDRLLAVAEDSLGFQLFEAIEETKRALSSRSSALFHFDYPGAEVQQEVGRVEFERACQGEVDMIVAALDDTLLRAGVEPGEIELVCLTGGTARVPRISQALGTRFASERLLPLRSLHAVSEGLGHHARLSMLGVPASGSEPSSG